MIIKISTAEVLYNIRRLAHIELEGAIPDESLRYKMEPGTEKLDDLKRIMLNAYGNLTELLSRFIISNGMPCDNCIIANMAVELPQNFTLELNSTSRRMAGKAQTVGASCFSYLTNAVLVEYYTSIALPNLANNHAQLLARDTENLNKAIYTKNQP